LNGDRIGQRSIGTEPEFLMANSPAGSSTSTAITQNSHRGMRRRRRRWGASDVVN
jgi:hypothetical protein